MARNGDMAIAHPIIAVVDDDAAVRNSLKFSLEIEGFMVRTYVSAEELLDRVWDEEADPFTNAVRITMMTLRRKLGDPPLIDTVIGVGYRLCSTG